MKNQCLLFLLSMSIFWSSCNAAPIKTSLLIKIPTRSRPERLFKTLDAYYAHLSQEVSVLFVISCDTDDESMNNPEVISRLNRYENLVYNFHPNTSKIEAFNRDLELYDFEMVIGAQDDSLPAIRGFDRIIVDTMHHHFPDLDGVLNLFDGHIGAECNTLPVIGRKFFDRFGYYYHPAYKALVCDVEITNVSKMLRKEHIVSELIIKHNHPAWGGTEHDALYLKNEQYHRIDVETFVQRRAMLYDLSVQELDDAATKMWSILMYAEPEKREALDALYQKLHQQIEELNLQHEIEMLTYVSSAEEKISQSRIQNNLMYQSSGKYIQFLYAGDDVDDTFIKRIYEKMQKNADCICLNGTITFDGKNPKKVIHSRQFESYFEKNGVYCRPPNPLNPIKRWIAIQFPFYEGLEFVDLDWAKRIAESRLIRTEEWIDAPYYFFNH